MKLNRFCSHLELLTLLSNGTIQNNTDHFQGGKGGSTSRGFCFTKDEPKTAWKYLRGIVSPGVCAVYEIPDDMLKKSFGKYAGDYVHTAHRTTYSTVIKEEYCCFELRKEMDPGTDSFGNDRRKYRSAVILPRV